MTVLIETVAHEFAANYLFNDRGLFPFFAADRRVKEGGGSQKAEFTYESEQWQVKLYYQDSGLKHPGPTTPEGTLFDLENLREFRLTIQNEDDPIGQRKFNAHLAPRWPGMRSKNGTEIPVPEEFGEGVNVRVTGSNIEFTEYLPLLQRAAAAVGIQGGYFSEPHPYSNVQDAERYVRLDRDVSGPIHSRDGPIARLGHLLENDREGYRKTVQNDQDEHRETFPGYYHTVTLDHHRIQEAFPSHALPKEIKHYYAKEAASFPKGHPLHHPKVGASYQVNRWDQKLGVSSDEIKQLNRELEETVLATLATSGIDLRPGGNTYMKDAYFSASESDRDREIIGLDVTQVEHTQESVVIKHLADGLSPVEWESLEVLVTDGGTVSPKEIAQMTERHPGSVRRALDRISELVDREYGSVSLRSNYVAELVYEAVNEAKRTARQAVEAGAKALAAADRGLDENTSAFIAWAASHDINVNERDDCIRLELGELDAEDHHREVRRILREGKRLWENAKRDPAIFRAGRYHYQIQEPEHDLRSVEANTVTQTVTGRVWEALR